MSPKPNGEERADESDCPGNEDGLSVPHIEFYRASEDGDPQDRREEIPSQLRAAGAHSYDCRIKRGAHCGDTGRPNQ
jgi:hypothetical protein